MKKPSILKIRRKNYWLGEFTGSGESCFFIHLHLGSKKMVTYPYENLLTEKHTPFFFHLSFLYNAVKSYAGSGLQNRWQKDSFP